MEGRGWHHHTGTAEVAVTAGCHDKPRLYALRADQAAAHVGSSCMF